MATLIRLTCASGLILFLAACAEEKAAENSSHQAALSSRQEVQLRLAHADENAGDFASAEHMYLQAAALSPSALETRLELADFYERRHKNHQAIDAYKQALAVAPKNTDVARALANAYIRAGMPELALKTLDRAIAYNDSDALLYNSKGAALDMQNRYGEAQQAYRAAIARDPEDAMTFKGNLGMSYILSHAYPKAIALLRPLLDMPDVTPTIRQNLALAYGMNGEADKALALGLKDLKPDAANENLRFYSMLSAHPAKAAVTPSDPELRATVREVFPEEEPAADDADPASSIAHMSAAAPLPAIAPAASEDVGDAPVAPVARPASENVINPPMPAAVIPTSLPLPVLKPQE